MKNMSKLASGMKKVKPQSFRRTVVLSFLFFLILMLRWMIIPDIAQL